MCEKKSMQGSVFDWIHKIYILPFDLDDSNAILFTFPAKVKNSILPVPCPTKSYFKFLF